MKKTTVMMFLLAIIGRMGALDTESYQFIDRLLRLERPGQPELIGDGVLFTAPSVHRKVGIAFAYEGFSKVYWFKNLMVIRNDISSEEWAAKKPPEIYHDSGILFYAHTAPEGLKELEYRLIIDGLWTTDPLNPSRRLDTVSGMLRSVVALPRPSAGQEIAETSWDGARFRFQAPPGETITVAGNFNGWDPFMYEMREISPGSYSLVLPLPPGTYRYVFFHQGKRFTDPQNPRRAYTGDGAPVSEIVVK